MVRLTEVKVVSLVPRKLLLGRISFWEKNKDEHGV